MKKILMLCLLAYSTHSIAQHKSITIDSLIRSNKFNFVVTEVKPNYGMKSTSIAASNTEIPNVNTTIPASERLAVLNQKNDGSDAVQIRYNNLEKDEAAYGGAFENGKTPNNLSSKSNYALYLTQNDDKISISNVINPANINAIKTNSFSSISSSQYKLKSKRKKNGTWILSYRFKADTKPNTLYLIVKQDGSASLKKDLEVILNGFLFSNS